MYTIVVVWCEATRRVVYATRRVLCTYGSNLESPVCNFERVVRRSHVYVGHTVRRPAPLLFTLQPPLSDASRLKRNDITLLDEAFDHVLELAA